MKTEIKSNADEVKDFYDKKITKADFIDTSLVLISLHSVLNKDKNYSLQLFLKQSKYIEKKSN